MLNNTHNAIKNIDKLLGDEKISAQRKMTELQMIKKHLTGCISAVQSETMKDFPKNSTFGFIGSGTEGTEHAIIKDPEDESAFVVLDEEFDDCTSGVKS